MSDEAVENQTEAPAEPTDKKKSPVRKVTLSLMLAIGLVFIWYVFSDRYTPYTDQGIIRGVSIPIYPRVSGYVTDIRVGLHANVSEGDTLFQLDRRPFELAVRQAEAQLENTAQQVGAQTATVKAAAGQLEAACGGASGAWRINSGL